MLVGLSLATLGDCDIVSQQAGTCIIAGVGDGQATLEGSGSSPGSGGLDYTRGESSGAADNPLDLCVYVLNDRCLRLGPEKSGSEQPITLADIAQFRPDQPIAGGEPAGWTVVGLATNFFATSAPEVHDGTLLGGVASVRFTPVAWHWSYGDGSAASLATGGSRWAALGVAEFDATPTSHTYRAPGSYTIRLSVEYSAEYRLGGAPWTRIAGTLQAPANDQEVAAGAAATVLVGRDCRTAASGPGC